MTDTPLSFEQERFYLLDSLGSGAAVHNLAFVYWLGGRLDVDALTEAITELHRRHAILRTRYPAVSHQEVLSAGHVTVPRQDLSGDPDPDAELRRRVDASVDEPFDLAAAPPVRWTLHTLGQDRHALTLVVHHIALDGWSRGLVSTELFALYQAFSAGEPAPAREKPMQYADYAAEQRARAQGGDQDEVDYWVGQLTGLPGSTRLPFDRPPGPDTGFGGRLDTVPLAEPVRRGAELFSRAEHASLFMVLMAGFAWQLAEYGDQRDFVIGVPTAGRTRPELEDVVGCFVDTLPVRVRPAVAPSFRALLGDIRDSTLDSFEHGGLSLARLVAAVRPDREPGREPLVQVSFGALNTVDGASEVAGLDVVEEERSPASAGLDLAVIMAEQSDGVSLLWEYKTELFDDTTIARFQADLEQIVRWGTENPDTPLSSFTGWAVPQAPTAAERTRLLGEWNSPARDVDTGSLPELFAAQVRRRPLALAVADENTRLSYAELDARSDRLARRLVALGVEIEDRVGVLMERSVDFVVAELAVVKAGGAYLPLDVRAPADRRRTVLAEAGCSVLLVDLEFQAAAEHLDVPKVLLVSDDGTAPPAELPGRIDPDNLAYVMYTSGSTGVPKGVAARHRDVVARARDTQVGGEPVRVLLHSPAAFDASTYELWVPLLAGGQVIVAPPGELDVDTLRRHIFEYQVTGLWLTGGLFGLIAQHAPECLATVREVWTGSDVIPAEVVRRVLWHCPRTTVVYAYGPTETTIHATCHRMRNLASVPDVLLIGRALDNTAVYLLDPRLRLVRPGEVGEVYIAGSGLARGYLNRPGLTADRFLPDPFGAPGTRMYRSGDLARWTEDGQLRFAGRVDEQVKIRGFRVELGEIQRAVTACPGVAQAAIIAREDMPGAKKLVGYLVPESGESTVDIADLRARLATTLPDYMVPSAFVVLERMPLTRNGKLDRRALPAPAREAADRTVLVPPRTEAERLVAGIWCELLDLPSVGVTEDFIGLGGHSLVAAQIVARLGERMPGLPVRGLMRDVLRNPTIAAFAPILAERMAEHSDGDSAVPVLSRGATLPLSLGQKRLWFLDQFVTHSAEYLVSLSLRISGPLDRAALTAALTEIVGRHEILRTSVLVENDEPVGVVRPVDSFTVPVVSVAEPDLARVVDDETTRPFDLENGLPVRAKLWRLGESDHVVCLTVHHMAFDGWSVGLFYDELEALYDAFSAGRPSPLAMPRVQYADVSAYQESRQDGPEFAAKLDFWRAELDGSAAFELSPDLPRPPRRTAPGASATFRVPAEVVAGLERIGAEHGATLFMTLLAAWQVLLHRYSGTDDVTVGTTAADRELTESESLLGLFINMLVLRGDLSGRPSFASLLERTRDHTLDVYAHQDVPFDRLVEELAPERDLARTPIFQVMVKLDSARQRQPALPGLEVRQLAPPPIPAKYDLEVGFTPQDGALAGELTYDTGLYLPDTIDRMIGHLHTLLADIVRDPGLPIDRLALMDPVELADVRVLTARPEIGFPRRCLHELIREQAARTPDAVAVVQDDRTLSYAELDAWSDEIAWRLMAHGAGPDVVVGVVLDRSVEMVVALLGVLKSGGAYLPIEPETPPARIGQLLADSRAPVCLVEPGLTEVVGAAGSQPLTVPVRGSAPASAPPRPAVDADHLVSVYYTSGSTGKPKGVACTHAGWVNRMYWMQRHHPLRVGETVLHKTTLPFDDSAVEIFWPLLTGATVAVLGAGLHRDPRAIADAVIRYRAVHVQFVPSMLDLFLAELSTMDVARMSALRSVLSSGEALRPELVGRFLERFGESVMLDNTWGATEVSIDSTCRVCTAADAAGAAAAVSVGRPIDNNEVRVLDAWFEQLPVGVAGELCIGGVGLARGYLGDPRRTAEVFVPHPELPGERVYRTGDWGRMGADGSLEFLRRNDDQVKIRGVRIELGEVEHALRAHSAVTDVAVIAYVAAGGDKRLAAYVVADCSAAELIEHARTLLPGYAVPGSITMLDGLPLLPNGKLNRRSLPEPVPADTSDDYVAPRTETEEALAEIWAGVLDRERIGVNDDFFAAGGHSLLATRAIARMRQVFVADIPLPLIFERPTVARAAAAIEEIVLAEVAELSDEEARQLLA